MKIRNFFIFLLIITQVKCKYPGWNKLLNLENIEKRLITEKVINIKLLKDKTVQVYGRRQLFLITLESGIKGIFKPRGFFSNRAEVAAYKASNFLKLHLVPPTVLRTIKTINGNIEGSLQFFVKTDCTKEAQDKMFFGLSERELSDIYVFQFVMGNFGWGPKNQYDTNIIVTSDKQIALIDYEEIAYIKKIRYGERPFVKVDLQKNWRSILNETSDFPNNYDGILKKENLQQNYNILAKFNCHSVIKYFSLFNSPFLIWADSLWVQNINSETKNYTRVFIQKTLNMLKNLNYEVLAKIWSYDPISCSQFQEYFELLFNLIIERRDQILISSRSGKILT